MDGPVSDRFLKSATNEGLMEPNHIEQMGKIQCNRLLTFL